MSTTVTETRNESIELSNFEHRSDSDRKGGVEELARRPSDDVPPPNAQAEIERWNHPRSNIARLAFAFLSFIIAGMNDAAVGVCIPTKLTFRTWKR